MSGGLLDSGRLAIRIGFLTIFAGLCVGCGTRTEPPVVSPVLEDGVAQCPKEGPPTNPAQLRACVGEVTFDTLELAGDEQRLMVNPPCPGSCQYGPLAKIEPVVGAQDYGEDELQRGRIIARLFVRRGEKGYPKLAIVSGYTTYWWVQTNATGRAGRSLFISEAMVGNQLMTVRRQLEVYPYPEGTFRRAIAGWYWLEQDETAKGTCGSATCK
jgi:hypothetical protein